MAQVIHPQQEEMKQVMQLIQEIYQTEQSFINTLFDNFLLSENIYAIKEEGNIVSVLLYQNMEWNNKKGRYYFLAATYAQHRRKGYMSSLLHFALQENNGAFSVLIPRGESLYAFYEKNGFNRTLSLRSLSKEIKPNLYATAIQDSLTADGLRNLREQYVQNLIAPEKSAYPLFHFLIYANGGTTLKTDNGYGVYFKKKDKLIFVELMAKSDNDAMEVLQAARNITGCFEADIQLSLQSNLFIGEGVRKPCALLHTKDVVDVEDAYFNLFAKLEN